jgi:hypothetical protein
MEEVDLIIDYAPRNNSCRSTSGARASPASREGEVAGTIKYPLLRQWRSRATVHSMTISPTMPCSAWVLPLLSTMPQRRSVTRPAATGTNHHSAICPG